MAGGRDWSIKIVLTDPEDETSAVAFQPDVVPEANPGDPLNADPTDIVGWNNRTSQYHQPWQSDASFKPLPDGAMTNEIEPWQGSTTQFTVSKPATGSTIFYICKAHPTEHGTIIVS
jgi:hypothetical protein